MTNFYPWGRWVDSAPHTSRFRSSWILVINVLIQNLLFSCSRFSFFSSRIIWWPSVTLLWWRHTCTTTKILWNLANFQKCLFFELWGEYMYWGRVYHVYCYVYSSILIVWNKVKMKIQNPDPDLEIRGEGGAILRTLRRRFPKKIFRPFGLQFGLRIRGAGPPGALPWIRHCLSG